MFIPSFLDLSSDSWVGFGLSAECLGISIVCPNCAKRFGVCDRCWRGHWYCSVECRSEAKRKSRSRANRRYRASEGGRKRQRMAQNRYRQKNVRDHSSKKSKTSLLRSPVTQFIKGVVNGASSNLCCRCGRKIQFFIDGRRFSRKLPHKRPGGAS